MRTFLGDFARTLVIVAAIIAYNWVVWLYAWPWTVVSLLRHVAPTIGEHDGLAVGRWLLTILLALWPFYLLALVIWAYLRLTDDR